MALRAFTPRPSPIQPSSTKSPHGMPRTSRFAALALLAAALPLSGQVSAQDAKDTISTRDGRKLRGVEVTEALSTVVRYKRKSEQGELQSSMVTEIEWDGVPDSYSTALGALRAGNFAEAANQFLDAAGKVQRAPLKAECEFLAAEALARGAGKDAARAQEAAQRLEQWISANADGLRLPDAMLALGGAQTAAGSSEAAEGTFKKLGDEAIARGWSQIWTARAKIGLARAQLARGDFGNARSTFRSTIAAAQSLQSADHVDPEIVQIEAEALVGTGDSLVREGKFDDALNYFRDDVGRKATNPAIKAAARAGEGEAIFLKAQGAGNQTAELRMAQIAFAEANLLDTVGGETTAKALYYSGLVVLALGAEREGANFKQRAMEYFDSVVREYGDTRFATLAAEELKK